MLRNVYKADNMMIMILMMLVVIAIFVLFLPWGLSDHGQTVPAKIADV